MAFQKSKTCPRCSGTGKVNGFSHVNRGKCFMCRGSGVLAAIPRQFQAPPPRYRVSLGNVEIWAGNCGDAQTALQRSTKAFMNHPSTIGRSFEELTATRIR